jgi:hypothetical protein
VQVQQFIRELLLSTGAMALSDIQGKTGCSLALLREACERIVRESMDYQLSSSAEGLVIRHV